MPGNLLAGHWALESSWAESHPGATAVALCDLEQTTDSLGTPISHLESENDSIAVTNWLQGLNSTHAQCVAPPHARVKWQTKGLFCLNPPPPGASILWSEVGSECLSNKTGGCLVGWAGLLFGLSRGMTGSEVGLSQPSWLLQGAHSFRHTQV